MLSREGAGEWPPTHQAGLSLIWNTAPLACLISSRASCGISSLSESPFSPVIQGAGVLSQRTNRYLPGDVGRWASRIDQEVEVVSMRKRADTASFQQTDEQQITYLAYDRKMFSPAHEVLLNARLPPAAQDAVDAVVADRGVDGRGVARPLLLCDKRQARRIVAARCWQAGTSLEIL